mmetsp:Transcript_132889/g.384223  ORF Transcript_132889/g.384223 Transcript_132889/m.384223 type:complete len:249 (-) Transcript_132889:63-809(-)
MPPAPGQEEPIKRMTKIVNSLLSKEDVAPFREPVDWRSLELWDYPKIITKMMDLGTIKRRLERGQYSTAHQVAEDIRLVWSNCMEYNADGSDFWLLAKSYSRKFEDRYRKVRYEYDCGEDLDEDGEPKEAKSPSSSASAPKSVASTKETVSTASVANSANLDVRARFGANLFLLSGMELGHVFSELELNCPNVLESWGDAKIEINVDEIPDDIFSRLQKYVNGLVEGPEGSLADSAESIPKKKKRKSS